MTSARGKHAADVLVQVPSGFTGRMAEGAFRALPAVSDRAPVQVGVTLADDDTFRAHQLRLAIAEVRRCRVLDRQRRVERRNARAAYLAAVARLRQLLHG